MNINNWHRHLKPMKGGYYEVNGVIVQFLRFRFIGKTHVRLDLTSRSYEYSTDEMPSALATWRPVNEDGKTSYDHIAEEEQYIKSQAETPTIEAEELPHGGLLSLAPPPAPEAPPPAVNHIESLDESIEETYKNFMATRIQNSDFMLQKLQETIMMLKGTNGKEFVPQAKQIVNAINATSKVMDGVNEFFKTGVALSKKHQKGTVNKDKNSDV